MKKLIPMTPIEDCDTDNRHLDVRSKASTWIDPEEIEAVECCPGESYDGGYHLRVIMKSGNKYEGWLAEEDFTDLTGDRLNELGTGEGQ